MASGLVGQADLSAATNTTVYTVPASTVSTVNISVCNRSASDATIRIALAASGTPGDSEYIEYDALVTKGVPLERTGIVLSAAKRVVVYSDIAGVSVSVWGFEE